MKHLKLFNQENEYLDVVQYLDAPNVSYVIETDTVYYNPFVETMIVATYNVGYSGEHVKLLCDHEGGYGGYGYGGESTYTFDINKIEEMYVDGIKLNEPVRYYTFNEPGEHVVKYKFYDIENALQFNFDFGSPFYNCTSLTSIAIPDGVTEIGNRAFDSCYSLTSVTLPNSVWIICERAFSNCSALTSVTLGNGVSSIGNSAFEYCTALTEIVIPNSVTSIENWAFVDCSSLTSVTLPNSVTSIGKGAFMRCSSLTSVTLPNSVTSIGEDAFSGCSSLTEIVIPNSFTSIEASTFYGCNSLTSVTLPNSVTSIGDGAFRSCSSLTGVYCKPTTPPTMTSNVFIDNASGRKIYVPMESVDAYKAATGWIYYASDIEGYNF